MKYFYNNNLLILGVTTLLLASCSITQQTIKEPHALVRFQKAEFNYSQQVEGHASSTKIVGIDWKRLFDTQQGKITKSFGAFIYGNVPNSKEEQYALYNLMTNNPGYDLIVYPQYIINTKAPGIGLFYKKTDIVAKARLAVSNNLFVNEGESPENAINKAEMENNLSTLQSTYDDLVLEMSNLKQNNAAEINDYKQKIAEKEAEYKQKLKLAKDAALAAEKAAYNAKIDQTEVVLTEIETPTLTEETVDPIISPKVRSTATTKVTPKANSTVSSTVVFTESTTVNTTTNSTADPIVSSTVKPTVSSTVVIQETPPAQTVVSTPKKANIIAASDTYILVIGSYSTAINAERSIANFNKTHPALQGQVGMVISGEKYRVGFINFKTRNESLMYKTNLIKSYPEFKDAWPFKP